MNRQQKGFTIIEVVLFVAISALLTSALLVGVGAGVSRQQYKDAVQSFAAFLRDEYSKVINVENDRKSGKCPLVVADGGTPTNRGQSDCVVVGRYIATLEDSGGVDGRAYRSWPVYGYKSGDRWSYTLGSESNDYNVGWGAKTKLSNQHHNAARIAILMYRHPETGQLAIRTHAGRYNDTTIANFFENKDENGNSYSANTHTQKREVCVYDNGWMVGERLSVFLSPHAGSSSAISVNPASEECRRG